MFDVPAVVGVPLTVQPVKERPAGRAPPVIEQVYGAVPPVTPIVWLYGVLMTPFGRLDRVSVRPPLAVMVRLSGPLVFPCGLELSVTLRVMLEVPATVGVPLTVQPFRAKPAGRTPDVIVHAYGCVPPVMPIGSLYGTPTVPLGRLVNVSVTVPLSVIVRLTGPVTLCCGFDVSDAWMTRFAVPAVVGVPLTVHPLIDNPAGSVPVRTTQA